MLPCVVLHVFLVVLKQFRDLQYGRQNATLSITTPMQTSPHCCSSFFHTGGHQRKNVESALFIYSM